MPMDDVLPGNKVILPEKSLRCWHEHSTVREYRQCSRRLVELEVNMADSLLDNFNKKTRNLREENKLLVKECADLRQRIKAIKKAIEYAGN